MKRTFNAIGSLFLLLLLCSPVWAENPWGWQPKTLEQHGENYTFEWAVPKLQRTPGDTAAWQKLLDHKLADRLNEFQNAFEESKRENVTIMRENPDFKPLPWESSGGYQAVWEDPEHLVLLWTGYDFRGGAHGIPVLEVTVLSAEQPDSLLPPSSLFCDETAVLSALSSACRASLQAQFAEPESKPSPEPDEWMVKGTEPRWENFSIVYPSQVGGPPHFEVIFPSYQVAPYSAGTPKVEIPWESLAGWAPALKDGVPLP